MGTSNSVHRTQPALNAGKSHDDEFNYKINTPHIDPRTGSILPTVNPLAMIPHRERTGQQVEVLWNTSHDFRGDIDHVVGHPHRDHHHLANPRALGALQDRQMIAKLNSNNGRHRQIPKNTM
jgi:hypothetical protein